MFKKLPITDFEKNQIRGFRDLENGSQNLKIDSTP